MALPNKDDIRAMYRKAQVAQSQKDYRTAISLYQQLLGILPGKPEVLFQLGKIHLEIKSYAEAKACLLAAAKRVPNEPEVLNALRESHSALGQFDEALALLNQLIKLDPKATKPRAQKALLYQQMGDFKAAETEFRRAIERDPHNGELYRSFGLTHKFKRSEPLIQRMVRTLKDPRSTNLNNMYLCYALAKAFEDTGDYDRVFGYLARANRIQAEQNPYSRLERRAELDEIKALYDAVQIAPWARSESFSPVFVCGMPRSGTTLVERILASHSKVTAAGEFAYAFRRSHAALNLGQQPPAAAIPEASAHQAAADFYRARLQRDLELSTPFVTDKSIQSYMVAGFLATAIPSSRFVILRRDPGDNALSIYKNFFAPGTHKYANRLEDIAWYMHTFEEMVAFWKERMPGRIYEISYEELTANQEEQSRKLLDAVGLDWEDQVMEFYKSEGSVKTLSLQQVRNPISQKSVGGWRRYEAEMQPFWDAYNEGQG